MQQPNHGGGQQGRETPGCAWLGTSTTVPITSSTKNGSSSGSVICNLLLASGGGAASRGMAVRGLGWFQMGFEGDTYAVSCSLWWTVDRAGLAQRGPRSELVQLNASGRDKLQVPSSASCDALEVPAPCSLLAIQTAW